MDQNAHKLRAVPKKNESHKEVSWRWGEGGQGIGDNQGNDNMRL